MSVIYEPKGRAREYSERAVNLYKGCSHGCRYCYAPAAVRQEKTSFHTQTLPRKNIIASISKEAVAHAGKEVLLCFTCDPYQQINDQLGLTRQALIALLAGGTKVTILTKGGERSETDFDLLSQNIPKVKYGATLTFTDEADSLNYEPYAAPPLERVRALEKAKKLGIPTWVSLEPVINTRQTRDLIEATADYVDHFKVGKLNNLKVAEQINWRSFANRTIELLERLGASYYIKKDLLAYLAK